VAARVGARGRRADHVPVTPAGSPAPLPFVPCGDLVDVPHVVVDGAAGPATVLSLSHWPLSRTPRALARDLSAEIAFAYLSSSTCWAADALAVTNDHVDQDGLVSLYALVDPDHARRHERTLVEIARVGDFAVVDDDEAAQLAFALAVLGDPERSPLAVAPVPGHVSDEAPTGDAWSRACYPALLAIVPELLEWPQRYAEIGAEERIALERSRSAFARGDATVRELPDVGLAVVSVEPSVTDAPASRFCRATSGPLHPAAIHAVTAAPRVLVVHGRRYRYYDRYETWVRVQTRKLPLRRDLEVVARLLTELEGSSTAWTADPPGALEPVLSPAGSSESSLDVDRVVAVLVDYLTRAPAAWDPFAGDSPLEDIRPPRQRGRSRLHRELDGRDVPATARGVSGPAVATRETTGRGRPRS